MQVRVLFFGVLKEMVGRSSDELELPDGSTLADLLARYQAESPKFKEFVTAIALSVNEVYARPATPLHDGDEVGLLPPVSGGSAKDARSMARSASRARQEVKRVAIVRDEIDVEALASRIRKTEDGAVCVFEGVVRDNTRGRRTLYLDYEAYEGMAEKQLSELVAEAKKKFAIREAAIVHRLGRLELGATSVAIVVASAHRGAAFDACRWLIDTLKKTVPIWKKEYFEDGAVWADGEPFPQEIRSGHPSGESS